MTRHAKTPQQRRYAMGSQRARSSERARATPPPVPVLDLLPPGRADVPPLSAAAHGPSNTEIRRKEQEGRRQLPRATGPDAAAS